MPDEWDEYLKDSRTICKYGAKCYQKNPEHHKTYKHPPLKLKTLEEPHKKRFRLSPSSENVEASSSSEPILKDKTAKTQYTEESRKDHVIVLPEMLCYHDKSTDNKVLKDLFLVEMPPDFFKFFECLNMEDQSIEKVLGSVNLEIIGPFDLLLGKLPLLEDKELYLIHWRFFYDTPEFQSVLKKKGQSQYHIGYFRDSPDDKPVFLGSNDSAKDCRITPMAQNIFGALYLYLQTEKKHSPFTSTACQKLAEKVKKWAEINQYSLAEFEIKKRLSQTVANTFHGAGIVVPYNKKTQLGYRTLAESDANIKKLFSKLVKAKSQVEKNKVLSELQPIITFANIAVDECDFGTGLEAGIDLFCSGLKELEADALNNLCSAYSLLKRDAFAKIIRVHLKYRRKGPNMSLMSQ